METCRSPRAGRLSSLSLFYIAGARQAGLTLAIPGRHNVANALAAAAGLSGLGASIACVKAGLEQMAPVKGRFCVQRWGGLTLVDDTYNASVESVLAGIDA